MGPRSENPGVLTTVAQDVDSVGRDNIHDDSHNPRLRVRIADIMFLSFLLGLFDASALGQYQNRTIGKYQAKPLAHYFCPAVRAPREGAVAICAFGNAHNMWPSDATRAGLRLKASKRMMEECLDGPQRVKPTRCERR